MARRLLLTSLAAGLLAITTRVLPSRSERATPPPPSRIGTVVYVDHGDLYVRDLPNGMVRRLTRDGGNEWPQWSPSGNWIAYFHEPTGLRVIRRDGSGVHTLPAYDGWQFTYSFSPKTENIAVVTSDGALVVSPLSERRLRTVVAASSRDPIVGVRWSPDGRILAYVTMHYGTAQQDDADYQVRLWVKDISGRTDGRPHLLYTSHAHEAVPCLCGWSSDGRYVLFWALHYFPASSVNRDGLPLYASSVQPAPGRARLLNGGTYRSMVLSIPDFVQPAPQSSRVAISVGGSRFWAENKRIALENLRTHSTHLVTPPTLAATCPTWSPDGTRIAYFATPAANSAADDDSFQKGRRELRLWTMNADGTTQRRLESGQAAMQSGPRWLGDGQMLLFERTTEDNKQSLWTIGADGHNPLCIAPHVGNDGDGSRGCDFDVWSRRTLTKWAE